MHPRFILFARLPPRSPLRDSFFALKSRCMINRQVHPSLHELKPLIESTGGAAAFDVRLTHVSMTKIDAGSASRMSSRKQSRSQYYSYYLTEIDVFTAPPGPPPRARRASQRTAITVASPLLFRTLEQRGCSRNEELEEHRGIFGNYCRRQGTGKYTYFSK